MRDLPEELTADQLDASFDRLVNSGNMELMTFYLAVMDMAYNGVKVTYHRYHEAFLIRARALYEQQALTPKEADGTQEDERAGVPASGN